MGFSNEQKKQAVERRYRHRIRLAEITSAPFGAGSFMSGNIVLIGEQASHPEGAPEQLPFCCHKGCSGWINWLLEEEKIPEEWLFWINVYNNDGSVADLNILNQIEPSLVVALGNHAAQECLKRGFDYIKLPHPQYWKRFKSKERYPLLDLLRKNIPWLD